ncbi:MAG: UDP-4-amino-4,6-dideoxy-N-acetyl-beta-L-altrosamine transaminase [Gammaproteobacteria bacterium]|nr:MAG: UDP-4-amino-4,6-dideoxy-N-acetyl-beta-L-altrosamine transaminase [Gammaproteobacteria bacterium]
MADAKHKPIRSSEDFLVFGAPLIGDEEKREVLACLDSGWLGTGPKVAEFERRFRDYAAGNHAVAVNSCTAALHLSMLAAGVGPGDEVITTAMTFCSTVNAIIHTGARPVLADIDPTSLNIDIAAVEAAITERTKAILPVHFAGRPCDMDPLCAIAQRHGLAMVEDCAHAIETEYHGRHAGTFGEYGCFSFYVTKNLMTGEGGMVVSRDEAHANRIKVLALHGMSKDAWSRFGDDGFRHYQVVECGYKYNMMDLQAALGLHQLARIEASWRRREAIWQTYLGELSDLPVMLPAPAEPKTRHAYHLFTIQVEPEHAGITRDEFLLAMQRENVGVGVHYRSIPTHPYYRETYGWRTEDTPHSLRVGESTVSLPLSAKLSDDDVGDVIAAVRKTLRTE